VDVVTPVPPLATGKVPVTPVVSGSPVAFVSTAEEGVPSAGVVRVGLVRVGLVANTNAPVPVSSVTAARKLSLEGVPSQVATPAPKADIPVPPLAAGKTPDTWVVKPIFPYEGATPIPPEIRALPVATSASFEMAVTPDA
jgi:hypothetical protein